MSSNLYPGVPFGLEAGKPSGSHGSREDLRDPHNQSHHQFVPYQEGGNHHDRGGRQSEALSQHYGYLQQLMRERDRIYHQLSQGVMPTLQRQNLDL